MSSMPFRLGLPVVDNLDTVTGDYMLRSENEKAFVEKLRDLQNALTTNDIIKVYPLGLRPDHPIPVSKFFAEIYIGIGEAEDWDTFHNFSSLYHWVANGLKTVKIIGSETN